MHFHVGPGALAQDTCLAIYGWENFLNGKSCLAVFQASPGQEFEESELDNE